MLLSSLSSSLSLFQNTKGGFIVFGEILNDDEEKGRGEGGGGAINIIEKNVMRNQQQSFNNTSSSSSFDIELSDHYYKNSGKVNLNNNFQFSSQPIVVINTNVFSCELEKIGSESICLSLSKCDEDNCRMKAEPTSNLIIIGKEPIYSLVTSSSSPSQSTSIYSMQVKLQPGEYEIFPKNNDVISSNYCNEIEIDGVGFEEFTMGTSIPQDNTSVLCINISDGCYGMIKIGETKVCEINKVFINK
ncbi:MAG TPA: hypothetical protein VFP49_06105 [Nitrososphaeraceae archaeon]|nr:hypothetical protein [Nitrososphaeraceae archaeon]